MRKHIFNAGPSVLPVSVLHQASEAVVDLDNSGQSILEISHRSKAFQEIIDEARDLVRELYQLPNNYEILFLQGGASSQFYMIPLNLMKADQVAAYVDTGNWSVKAIEEARKMCQIEVVASSKNEEYRCIPRDLDIPEHFKYLHVTSNNTIRGTQYHDWPDTNVPLVADMSSDILSRSLDIKRFGLIYAGAQKNLGPAGTTLVIINRNFIQDARTDIPTLLQYKTHVDKGSLFHTPPVFPIYVSMLNLRWIRDQGGIAAIHQRNEKKAALLYDTLDKSKLFYGTADSRDRSLMNIPFLIRNKNLEVEFIKNCEEAGIVGIKGHRSVGGFRASMYNALDITSVSLLCEVIHSFEKQYG